MSSELEAFVQKVSKDLNEAVKEGHSENLFKDIQDAFTLRQTKHVDQKTVQELEDNLNKQNKALGLPDLKIVGFGGSDHQGAHKDQQDYVLIQQKNENHSTSTFKVDADGKVHKVDHVGDAHDPHKIIIDEKTTYHFDKTTKHYVADAPQTAAPPKVEAPPPKIAPQAGVPEAPPPTDTPQPGQKSKPPDQIPHPKAL